MRLFFTTMFILMILPALAMADDITTKSEINAVTVYTNRAKVTRTAIIDVPKGAHKVIFKNLPLGLMADSLRVEGSAEAEISFGAVSHKRVMSSELTSKKEKSLNDQLVKLQDDLNLFEIERQALKSKRDFINNIAKQASLRSDEAIAELNLNTEQWANAAEVIYNGLSAIGKAKNTINLKTKAINKEKTRIRGELNQLRTGNRSSYQVIVPLESAKATKLTIELSYQIGNATWKPIYDARLNTEEKSDLKIVQYGSVSQRTGEDWNNVELTLSTAQPHRGTSLPDLKPFWVNIWENQPHHGYSDEKAESLISSPTMRASNMAMDSVSYAASPMKKRVKSAFKTAEIKTGGFVSEYKIFGKNNIPADGTKTKLMIGTFDTSSIVQIHVKPQLSTEAFLVAKAKLKGDSPILPGQVNLFRDGAYVGQTRFPLLRPSEEHGLYFGVDDKVSVKRKILADERSETGVIMKDNEQTRYFLTELQNLHNSAVEIVVKETVPVPKNEDITVSIVRNKTTKGFEMDAANIKGMLRWKFMMEPKSKKNINLGWSVTWPIDSNISGL